MNLGIAAVFGNFPEPAACPDLRALTSCGAFCGWCGPVRRNTGPSGLSISDLFITDAAGGVTFAAGAVTVSVGSGWKLCFQKQYREFWTAPDREGSFSRTMTPDVVAAQAGAAAGEPGRLIVLDAKYRIDDALNDALSSIHTYRDALVREVESGRPEGIVTAAYLLTPPHSRVACGISRDEDARPPLSPGLPDGGSVSAQ